MTDRDGETQAMILSGGGAYAAYEVGVMKALFNGESPVTAYTPLNPKIFAGTSAGALNAAVIVSEPGSKCSSTVRHLESIWVNQIADQLNGCAHRVLRYRLDLLKFFDPDCFARNPIKPFFELAQDTVFFAQDWFRRGINFTRSSVDLNQRTLELVDLGTLVSAEASAELVKKAIRIEGIRQSDRVLRIATTNWRTGALRVFGNENMTDEIGHQVILASIAIPGVFASLEIEGEPYVDGALVMNTPLKPAIDAGALTLHVIYLDPDVQAIPLSRVRNTVSTLYRIAVIGFAAKMNRDIEIASRINKGLVLLAREANDVTPFHSDVRSSVLIAGRLRRHVKQSSTYRKLTIHRYHPREDLGGPFRWLSFSRDHLIQLMGQGFADAREHDCTASRCILPD